MTREEIFKELKAHREQVFEQLTNISKTQDNATKAVSDKLDKLIQLLENKELIGHGDIDG